MEGFRVSSFKVTNKVTNNRDLETVDLASKNLETLKL